MALPFVLALLAGCDPHDATVNAKYAMYFSEAVSDNILRLRQQEAYAPVQCEFEQSDPLADEIDNEQLFKDDCWSDKVAVEQKFEDDYNLEPFDCRTFGGSPYNDNPIRIRDAMIPGWEDEYEDFCCAEARDDDPDNDPDGDIFTSDDCTVVTGKFLDTLDDRSYYLNHGDVTTWREEAMINSEGDLQLTLHMDTPFGDVRFGWVVDPDFQPTECVDDGDGAKEQGLFGDEDVIKNWSAGEEDGTTLFYLNANAAQINPNDTAVAWYFEQDWAAGSAFSRFGDELGGLYSTDYAEYSSTATIPYFVSTDDEGKVTGGYGNYGGERYTELNCDPDLPADCGKYKDYPDFVESMQDNFTNGGTNEDGDKVEPADDDLANYGKLPQDEFPFHVKIEDNSWRKTEPGRGDDASGLDNWVGVNASWVRFQADPDKIAALEPGTLDTPLKGDFQIYMYSADSTGSIWFFTGSFEIATIERDTWGYSPELDEIKRDENDTKTCGE